MDNWMSCELRAEVCGEPVQIGCSSMLKRAGGLGVKGSGVWTELLRRLVLIDIHLCHQSRWSKLDRPTERIRTKLDVELDVTF